MSAIRETVRRKSNTNQSIATQSDVLSAATPNKRKKERKKRTSDELLQSLLKRVDAALKYKKLREMIHIDPELSYWYCKSCRAAGVKPCGLTKCNQVQSGRIISHCTKGNHTQVISTDPVLKALNDKKLKSIAEQEAENKRLTQTKVPPLPQLPSNDASTATNVTTTTSALPITRPLFNPHSRFHKNIQKALRILTLSRPLNTDSMKMFRYFNVVHREIKRLYSLRSISVNLDSEFEHGADIPAHYMGLPDVKVAIECLSKAQKEMDDDVIRWNKCISLSEDGNSLRGLGARGYMIKLSGFNWEPRKLFYKLENIEKPLSQSFRQLGTVDTGADTVLAMENFVKRDLKRTTKSVVTIATDGSGSNLSKCWSQSIC